MPITIRCPACDTQVSAPDAAAGRASSARVRRGAERAATGRGRPRLDGRTAARPPAAPAPAATATSGAADPPPPDADAAPQPPPEPIRDDEPEPWYYRFIERVRNCVYMDWTYPYCAYRSPP